MFALPPIATLAAFFGMSALGQKRRLRGLAIKARWRRTTAFDIGISTDFNVRFRLRLRFVDVRFGSKADICAANVMSALPLKATGIADIVGFR